MTKKSVRLKAGFYNPMWVYHVYGRGPNPWAIFTVFTGTLAGTYTGNGKTQNVTPVESWYETVPYYWLLPRSLLLDYVRCYIRVYTYMNLFFLMTQCMCELIKTAASMFPDQLHAGHLHSYFT